MSVIEKTTGEVCEMEWVAVKDHRVLQICTYYYL